MIEKLHEPERAASSFLAEMESAAETIRQQAFDYYRKRGGTSGGDLDDWLSAERKVIWTSRAEMSAGEEEIISRVDAAGLARKNLPVTATARSSVLRDDTGHQHDESDGGVCDFGEKLFLRFELPNAIDVDRVAATIDRGILRSLRKSGATAEISDVLVLAQTSQSRCIGRHSWLASLASNK